MINRQKLFQIIFIVLILLSRDIFAQNVTKSEKAPQDIDMTFDPIVPFNLIESKEDELLDDLIRLKKETGIHRFIIVWPWFIAQSRGLLPVEEYRQFGERLRKAQEKVAPYDIQLGWWCAPTLKGAINHFPDHQNPASPYYFQNIVDITGRVAVDTMMNYSSYCPLDQNYRSYFSNCIKAVVEIAHPFVVFFEDDYELSNHQPDISYGCFCPKHIKQFSEMMGEDFTREKLVEIFNSGGDKAAKYRLAWADLSRQSLVEMAKDIRKAIDQANPHTRAGLCQSGVADFDGNFTGPVSLALAGNTRPLVRLYGATYGSDDPKCLPVISYHFGYTRHNLPKQVETIHESDVWPHSRFFVSAEKLRSYISLAMLYGLDGSLSYITQYLDGPLEDKGYQHMIRENWLFFEALKKVGKTSSPVGAIIPFRPERHAFTPLPDPPRRPYSGTSPWVKLLGQLGIPYAFDGDGVPVLAGEDVYGFSEKEIKKILSRGAIFDSRAAEILAQKGYSDLIGTDVTDVDKPSRVKYESLSEDNPWRDNTEGDYMYFWGLGKLPGGERNQVKKLLPLKGTQVVSSFLDGNESFVSPAMVLYENTLGGRVAVMAYDLAGTSGSSLLNYKKKEQMCGILEWIGGKNLPIYVQEQPNIFVIALENESGLYHTAAIFNMCLDKISSLHIIIDEKWKTDNISLLEDDGHWVKLNDVSFKDRGNGKWEFHAPVECRTIHPVVLRFDK